MDKKRPHLPMQEIDKDAAFALVRKLHVAKELSGALIGEKHRSYGTSRYYSVGKPDFDYHVYLSEDDQKVRERKRLRVIERWMSDTVLHGVVHVQMSFVYRSSTQLGDAISEDALSDAIAAQIDTATNNVAIFEGMRSSQDVCFKKRLIMGFMASGKVMGKLLVRDMEEVPNTDGCTSEHIVDMAHFYAEKPFFEEDFRHSTPGELDIQDTTSYVDDFIEEEKRLASLRSALQG